MLTFFLSYFWKTHKHRGHEWLFQLESLPYFSLLVRKDEKLITLIKSETMLNWDGVGILLRFSLTLINFCSLGMIFQRLVISACFVFVAWCLSSFGAIHGNDSFRYSFCPVCSLCVMEPSIVSRLKLFTVSDMSLTHFFSPSIIFVCFLSVLQCGFSYK